MSVLLHAATLAANPEHDLDALQAVAKEMAVLAARHAALSVRRDRLIVEAWAAGVVLRDIARASRVHYTRVRQIVAAHLRRK